MPEIKGAVQVRLNAGMIILMDGFYTFGFGFSDYPELRVSGKETAHIILSAFNAKASLGLVQSIASPEATAFIRNCVVPSAGLPASYRYQPTFARLLGL
jgi:hypothetical protein